MSKRLPTNNTPANAPAAKKPRIDIEGTAYEVKILNTHLIDVLKAQKAAVQWGHTTCRDDTMASITKAEMMMGSVEKLEKTAKEASSAVEKLIDALIQSEFKTLIERLERHSIVDEDYEMPDTRVLEAMQYSSQAIVQTAKKQVKETLKDLTVDEVIKKVQAETKSAYKAAARKKFADTLENVLG